MDLEKLTDDELERIAYGRFRWEADIIARVGPAGRVAIDPYPTFIDLDQPRAVPFRFIRLQLR